jgi:hypothetical protein
VIVKGDLIVGGNLIGEKEERRSSYGGENDQSTLYAYTKMTSLHPLQIVKGGSG